MGDNRVSGGEMMADSATSPLLIERRGAVDWVTLNRPERLNALDETLTRALGDYFEGLRDDDRCRVVVLRGAGRGFCAGADLASDLTRSVLDDGIGTAMRVQRALRNVMLAMRRCPQPIVSLLHGAAVGGGFVLALASDIRLATPEVRMNAAFIKIGLGGCDVGVSYLLPRLIGASAAYELLLTGRDLGADRALRLGLISEIVARDDLEAGRIRLCRADARHRAARSRLHQGRAQRESRCAELRGGDRAGGSQPGIVVAKRRLSRRRGRL
jgi:enoyl-CoA hydratase/carnithine racemase